MSKYIDGTRIVYFDDSNGNLTVPSTLNVGSLSTGSVRVSSIATQTANVSTLTTTTQTGSSASISSLTTNFVSTGRVLISSIVGNNVSSTTSRSGAAFVTSLSTPILNVSSLTTPGKLTISSIRNDETVTTGFLHYNLSTNEVVYNAQGGSGGGGTSALVTASTILATESLIAPTQFYAQELYTNAAYDFTKFCTQFTATGPSALWCGIAVSATGQYMTAIDNGATYPAGGFIYSSSNFGSTWNQVASQQGWGQVAMNATGQIQIAAVGLGPYGYNGQIYRSTNYGATWSVLAGSFYTFWASLAVSASGQYMVGTDHFSGFNTNGYVYTSSDFGITWTRLTSLPFVVLGPIRVSASGQYQTVTGQGIPLYRSSDYGQTWSSTGTTDRYAGVAVSASGQYQTATSFTFDGGSGSIYVSANYGATWTVYGSTGIIYRQPAISASGRYQAIFVIDSGMYYSSNYGVTWTFIASPNVSLYGIAMSAAGDYVVVVARDPQQRIYINSLPLLQVATNSLTASNAVISSLTASNAMMGPLTASDTGVSSLVVANNVVVGGTILSQTTLNTNVLNLSAFAQSFSLVNNPGTFNLTSAVSATGQYQLVGTSTFLYVSSNFGSTWTQVATDRDWAGVAISGTGNFMYATDATSSTGNLYRSTDYGLTWVVVPSSPGAGAWLYVAISASGQYVLACGPSYYYLSSNYGASFSQVENYSTASLGFIAISATGQYMMIRTLGGNVVSNNYGATWTAISRTSYGYALAISGTGQYQMAADNPTNTLYISSDYGATFTASLVGANFWSCAIDYTGQYQVISQVGINKYYSVNYGVTWTVVANIDPAQSRNVSMSANAQYLLIPNTNGPFYLNRNSVWFPAGISTATAQVSSLTTNSIATSGSFFVSSLRTDPALTTGIVRYNSTTKELIYNEVGGGGTQSTISSYQNAYVSSLGINCNSPRFVLDVNGTGNFISTLTHFASISTANISTANISTAFISSAQIGFLGASSFTASSITSFNTSTVNATITSSLTFRYPYFSWLGQGTANNFVQTSALSNLNISSGLFTLECYFNPTVTNAEWGTIVSLNNGTTTPGNEFRIAQRVFNLGFGMLFPITSGTTAGLSNITNTLPLNSWYHIALVRTSATNLFLYSNGTAVLSTTSVNYSQNQNMQLQIFRDPFSVGNDLGQGYIQSVRFTAGQALYTGNFTPPTQQLTRNSVGTSGTGAASQITGTVAFLGGVTSTFTDVGPYSLALTAGTSNTTTNIVPSTFSSIFLTTFGNNLGINCNAPSFTLDVNGSANFNGIVNMDNLPDNNVLINSAAQQILLSNTNSTYMYMQAPGNRIRIGGYSNTSGMPFTINESGGNVGINCNAPQNTLDVNGTTRIQSDRGILTFQGTTDTDSLYIRYQKSTLLGLVGWFGFGVGGTEFSSFFGMTTPASTNIVFLPGGSAATSPPFYLGSNSRVGLGTSNPSVQLDLTTDGARKLTTNTWTTGSDQRIKKNISSANIDLCYSTLKAIDLKYFEWDTSIPQLSTIQDHHSLGFIAQEVKTVFPKAVTFDSNMGFSDFHSLNVDQLYKAHYGATKKLIDIVETQSTQIAQLLSDNSTLISYIPQLASTLRG